MTNANSVTPSPSKKKFLTAYWRHLIMANYVVDPVVLKPYIPAGTQLDFYNGKTYISLVGFMFLKTRVKGFALPFFMNFPEVNLRFYVTFEQGGVLKRGVVFIKELVPRYLIAKIANVVYHENYQAVPMKNTLIEMGEHLDIRYSWLMADRWHTLEAKVQKNAQPITSGTEPEYIAEHYWGYSKYDSDVTIEYEVKHPKWNLLPLVDFDIDIDATAIYGQQFAYFMKQKPKSVFVADGSDISVHSGTKI